MYLSNTAHDTFTDLGVKHDEEILKGTSVGKIKIKRDSYRGKELATRPFPSFWQSVSGHSVHLFIELKKW